MTESPDAFQYGDDLSAPDAVESNSMPRYGYRVIGAMSAVLGGLGIFRVLVSTVMIVLSQVDMAPNGNRAADKFMGLMAERSREIAEQLLAYSIFSNMVHFGLTIALLAGGVMVLLGFPRGRSVLANACVWAIIFELCRAGLYAYTSYLNHAAVTELMATHPGLMPEGFDVGYRLGLWFGLAVAGLYVLAKLLFYAFSVHYLNKHYIRVLFGDAPSDEEAGLRVGGEEHAPMASV